MKKKTITDIISHYNQLFPDRFKSDALGNWPVYYYCIKDQYKNSNILIDYQPSGVNMTDYVKQTMENYLLPEFRQSKINSILD